MLRSFKLGILLALLAVANLKAATWGAVKTNFDAGLQLRRGWALGLETMTNGSVLVSGSFQRIGGERRVSLAVINPNGTVASNRFQVGSFSGFKGFPLADGGVFVAGFLADTNNVYRRAWKLGPDGFPIADLASFRLTDPWRTASHPDRSITAFTETEALRFDASGTLLGATTNASQAYPYPVLAGLAGGRVLGSFSTNELQILGTNGQFETTFALRGFVSGTSYFVVQSPTGGFFVQAWPTRISSSLSNGLYKIRTDGSVDYSFVATIGAYSSVTGTAALSDGGALVTGILYDTNGVRLPTLIRLGATGQVVNTFSNVFGTNGYIPSLTRGPTNSWYCFVDDGTTTKIRRFTEDGADVPECSVELQAWPYLTSIAELNNGDVALGGYPDGLTAGAVQFRSDAGWLLKSHFENGQGSVLDMRVRRDGSLIAFGWFGDLFNLVMFSDHNLVPGGIHGDIGGFGQSSITWNLLSEDSKGRLLVSQSGYPLVRINNDGTLDDLFMYGGNFERTLQNMVWPDGRILVSGYSYISDGKSRHGIERLLPDGEIDPTFQTVGSTNQWLILLALLPDGSALAARQSPTFQDLFSDSGLRLVRVMPNGGLDPSYVSPVGRDSSVNCAAVQRDGRVLLGGLLFKANGEPAGPIVRLEPDGTLDTTFATDLPKSGSVLAIEPLADGDLLVGGSFETADGRYSVTRLSSVERPRLRPVGWTNGIPVLSLEGNKGRVYSVDASTNLIHWNPVTTVTNLSRTNTIVLTNATSASGQYFRAHVAE